MFHPEECVQHYFEDHVLRSGNQYDYVWCAIDVDVHNHGDFYELMIPAGGSYYHYHNGETKEISKNTIFLFKPGESHGLEKSSPQSVHFSFFAKKEFMEHFFEEYSVFRRMLYRDNYLSCELSDVEYEYIHKLAISLTYQENEYQQVSLLLYNVLSLLSLYNEKGSTDSKNEYVLDLIGKMNNYTYLTTKISDIYSSYPIARTTLIKEFKESTGMTIVQYQRKQKMAYAAQLLVSSDYQVTKIADILEFDSFSHFLRVFKEHYGETPKEYRKRRRR